MYEFDAANAGFGALAFAAIGTVVIVAGFKFRWLRSKNTVILCGLFVLLVTVNSAGLLGTVAGAIRGGLNAAGEAAVTGATGTEAAPNPPKAEVPVLTAGGALVGLCGIAWYAVKLFAARGRAKDTKEMAIGASVGICYGTALGFTGYLVGFTIFAANNIGLWAFGG